ncbi:hypothetical protein Q3G72_012208 [Acer saccharum]|nr:hypothetical protein Q3G72_012208 [Acer saccharum]
MGGGGGELRYEISQNAYIKLVLYARKHKTAAVNGVLVGRVSPQKNDVVEITDSVPRLSPVMKQPQMTNSNHKRNWWRRKKSTPPTTSLQELRIRLQKCQSHNWTPL